MQIRRNAKSILGNELSHSLVSDRRLLYVNQDDEIVKKVELISCRSQIKLIMMRIKVDSGMGIWMWIRDGDYEVS